MNKKELESRKSKSKQALHLFGPTAREPRQTLRNQMHWDKTSAILPYASHAYTIT